jgi:paraquat-inducible protein B
VNRPAAWRVGLFVLAGTAVLVLALLWVARDWLGATERVQLRFEGSVWGLQAGAPVVLRGVRVGQVLRIGLDGAGPGVPVLAELDRAALAPLLAGPGVGTGAGAGDGPDDGPGDGPLAPRLVQRGLVATLATQSLLTGLLYVDLEFDAARAAAAGTPAAPPAAADPTPIPTRPTVLSNLQRQLAAMDMAALGADLQAVVAAARRTLAQPEADQALARAARAAAALETLAMQLQKDWPPLARSASGVLEGTRTALRDVAPAAAQAARDVSAAASAAGGVARGLGSDGRAALKSVQAASDELSRAAQQLGTLTAADGALAQGTQRALADVSRAARALRELADLLERHPDALLRGRADTGDRPETAR